MKRMNRADRKEKRRQFAATRQEQIKENEKRCRRCYTKCTIKFYKRRLIDVCAFYTESES